MRVIICILLFIQYVVFFMPVLECSGKADYLSPNSFVKNFELAELHQAVLSRYGFQLTDIEYVEKITRGTRQATYKIIIRGQSYILKKEPQKEGAVRFMTGISAFYRSLNFPLPFPKYILNTEHSAVTVVDGAVFTLQEMLPGKVPGWGMISNELLIKWAAVLARIHVDGSHYQPKEGEISFQMGDDPYFKQIDDFKTVQREITEAYEKFKEINRELEKHQEENKSIIRLALRYESLVMDAIQDIDGILFRTGLFQRFPMSFCVHGDFVNVNLLEEQNRPSGVIDIERIRQHATRWEDILRPVFHLPAVRTGQTFNFDRFALWLTAYNQSLPAASRLMLEERKPEVLRSLVMMSYLRELLVGIKNRHQWTKASFIREQFQNLKMIYDLPIEKFTKLSDLLAKGELWSTVHNVPEPGLRIDRQSRDKDFLSAA